MSLEAELEAAGFARDAEVTELDLSREYAVTLTEDRPIARLLPSDMLNGWWYSRLDAKAKAFDFVRVPIGLKWISRELQKIAVRDVPFQWWYKSIQGVSKCHPWAKDSYSRVYASNLVPLSTVTVGHESYPGSIRNYLLADPFLVWGEDPSPKMGASSPTVQTVPEVPATLSDITEATVAFLRERKSEIQRAAFATGRLNLQDEIDRIAREEAARRADAIFKFEAEDEERVGPPRRRRRREKKAVVAAKPNPILPTGRKIDL